MSRGGVSYDERLSRFISLDGMQTRLHRWRLNLVTGLVKRNACPDTITEFGMINGLHGGRQHRYTYAATGVARAVPVQRPGQARRRDRRRGALRASATGCSAARPRWPRVWAVPGEDDGYLVTLTIDVVERPHRSAGCFDAARVADGPIARVRLPERISSGTHSTWAPGSALPGWDAA